MVVFMVIVLSLAIVADLATTRKAPKSPRYYRGKARNGNR